MDIKTEDEIVEEIKKELIQYSPKTKSRIIEKVILKEAGLK